MIKFDPFTHKIWVNGSSSHLYFEIDPFTHIFVVNGSILVTIIHD